MRLEILSPEQAELLKLLEPFAKKYYLVGGTAIALYLGHRKSLDFDLFTFGKLNKTKIRETLSKWKYKATLIHEMDDQMHYFVNGVKLKLFSFPFKIPTKKSIGFVLDFPEIESLAAMKAFALGGRGKWKEYVDLYFILKSGLNLDKICLKAKTLFDDHFNPTLFFKQLIYFDDISFQEEVEYLPGFEISEEEVKNSLIAMATE